jgi:hypothetical protein
LNQQLAEKSAESAYPQKPFAQEVFTILNASLRKFAQEAFENPSSSSAATPPSRIAISLIARAKSPLEPSA